MMRFFFAQQHEGLSQGMLGLFRPAQQFLSIYYSGVLSHYDGQFTRGC